MKLLPIIIIVLLNNCNSPMGIDQPIERNETNIYGAIVDISGEVEYIGNGIKYKNMVYSEGDNHGAWCKKGIIFDPKNDTIIISEYYEIRYPDNDPTWFVRRNRFPFRVSYKTDNNQTFFDTLEYWCMQKPTTWY
jgi:hypothetical protein